MARRQPMICKHCQNEFMGRSSRLFCSRQCSARFQMKKPVTREWLFQKYVTERLNTSQIAEIVNRDPKTVWLWLKSYEIPTRGRGYGRPANWFPKGHKLRAGKKLSEAHKQKLREVSLATGRVPYDPAVGSYMKGRKGADTPNWKGGVTPERQSLYSSPEWKAAVKAVYRRENATCQRCDRKAGDARKEGIKMCLHHMYSFAEYRRLRTNPDNLALLCGPCHYWVHSKKNVNRDFLTKSMELPAWLQSKQSA